MLTKTSPTTVSQAAPGQRRTPEFLALVWSVSIGALSVLWMSGVLDFPFERYGTSLLGQTPARVAQILMLTSSVLGLALSAMHLRRISAPSRVLTIGTLILAITLVFSMPDWRVLAAVGYTPIVIIGVVIGTEPISSFADIWNGTTLILLFGMIAGLCFTVLTVRSWPARQRPQLETPRLLSIGRVATYIATVVPVGYALTRICWALGIPFGITSEFLRQIHGIRIIGLGLALFAIVGAILTLGLAQRWGAVFPSWIPGLRGKPVPVNLAVIPALVVSVLVASAGVGFVRDVIAGDIAMAPRDAISQPAAWLPEMFWPLWGVALATAALAYRERRRREARRQDHLLPAAGDRRTP